MPDVEPIAFIVVLAFVGYGVEAALGFGSTLLIMAIGASTLSVPLVLSLCAPLSILMSAWIVFTGRRNIAWSTWLKSLLPVMAIGYLAGRLLAGFIPPQSIRLALAGLLLFASFKQLQAIYGTARITQSIPSPRSGWFLGAGLSQGLLGVGGPMAVAGLSPYKLPPLVQRNTLSLTWLIFNILLFTELFIQGAYNQPFTRNAVLAGIPAMAIGFVVGSSVLRRLPPKYFRVAVATLIAVAALFQLVLSLRSQ